MFILTWSRTALTLTPNYLDPERPWPRTTLTSLGSQIMLSLKFAQLKALLKASQIFLPTTLSTCLMPVHPSPERPWPYSSPKECLATNKFDLGWPEKWETVQINGEVERQNRSIGQSIEWIAWTWLWALVASLKWCETSRKSTPRSK